MSKFSLDDYIDVAERIQIFKEKHPDGSLQTIDWSVVPVGDATFIVYRAAAFRTPDDERPGHGTAWEPFPGATPYTKNSELMNAETAAWGRAIVALGLTANRKLASRQEVKARAEEEPVVQSTPSVGANVGPASQKQKALIYAKADEKKLSNDQLANVVLASVGSDPRTFKPDQASEWLSRALDKLPWSKVDVVLKGIDAA